MKRYVPLLAMKTALVLLVITWATVLCGQPARANLLVNGSFEDTNGTYVDDGGYDSLNNGSTAIPGWTVISNSIAWIPTNAVGITASNGSYFLDLTGDHQSPFGGVKQEITLAPGQYRLEFDLGDLANYNGDTRSGITVTVGSSTPQNFVSPTFTGWEHFTMTFSASGSTTISFVGFQGMDYIGLDNVTLSSVPLAPSALLLGSGLLGLGLLRRKWGLKA
jgi:hypothetical protein